MIGVARIKNPTGILRYTRLYVVVKVSEGAIMCYLRKYIFHFMGQSPELRITQLIQEMQEVPVIDKDLLASYRRYLH